MKKNVNLGLALTRVSIGFPMLFYGVNKLFNGIDFIQQLLINNGLPGLLGYGVYLGEIVAPLFILIGLRTRIASLIFSINCITAILLAKSQHVFELNSSGGWSIELLFTYSLVSLSLAFTGAGKFSISSQSNWD